MVVSLGSSSSGVWAGWKPHGLCASVSSGDDVDLWW